MITECPGCGTHWADARRMCDGGYCGRADLASNLYTLRRRHYQPKRPPVLTAAAMNKGWLAPRPKPPRVVVHRIR